jgi:uncharacterized protein (DUF2252 family)
MEEVQPAFRSFDCTVQQKRGWLAETDSFDESLRQVGATGSLGDRPMVVLSRDPRVQQTGLDQRSFEQRKSAEAVWEQLQEELARLSSRGCRRIATGSGHQVHRERPDLVIGAIRDVVAQCGTAQ